LTKVNFVVYLIVMKKRGEHVMEKVKCTRCGAIGYTASPDSVKCHRCGGSHRIIEIDRAGYKVKDKDTYYHIGSLNDRGR